MPISKINKKTMLGVFALVCCIGIIALCSFFPFIIDPTKWQTKEFLSDELIVCSISIFSIVCVMMISQSSNSSNPKSNICRARVKFLGGVDEGGTYVPGSVDRITKGGLISGFGQWVRQVLQPSDIRSAKEKMVMRAGMEDVTVLDLEPVELESLTNGPMKIGNKFYKSITKKQMDEVKKAKRATFALVDPSYYLNCSKNANDRTITEQSGGETKKKSILLSWSIISKVFMSIMIAMVFTSLVRDTTQGGDAATAWMKFAVRMLSMATSSMMGYFVGCQMNDIDAYYIELKCFVHDTFFNDKSFKAKSQQEEAKISYEKQIHG